MTATNDLPSDRDGMESARGGKLGGVAGRADGGKRILHTIDPEMLLAWGRVLTFGAQKYHQRNFMVAPGMAWGRVYDSCLGHLLKFWAGEWLDEESGEPHIAHILCNLQFLWTYHQHPQYRLSDDRPASVEYAGITYADWEERFNEARSPLPSPPPPERRASEAIDAQIRASEALPKPADFNGEPMPYKATVNRIEEVIEHCARFNRVEARICLADIKNLLNAAKRGLAK